MIPIKDFLIECICGIYGERDSIRILLREYKSQLTVENAYMILYHFQLDEQLTLELLQILEKDRVLFIKYLTKNKCSKFNKLTISNKNYILNKVDIDMNKQLIDNYAQLETQYKHIKLKDKKKIEYIDSIYKSKLVYKKMRQNL